MSDVFQEKKVLIEEIGLTLEERAGLAPLAARIYATLILSSNAGLTFDEIIEITAACKSSVSSNLNVLLQLDYVEFYTKTGDRKRYFKTSPNFVKNAMSHYGSLLKKELEVINKVRTFNQLNNPEKYYSDKTVGLMYQEHLIAQLESIDQKIQEISALQNQSI
ncbi:GbsR/MarR family transcriptional regulator [Arenibacter certesii]|uniref:Transcriptional regulator n=1 Tax=Arenibacter certesii TaxID=228955 RepID=A0A918IQ54_9FLAO|nr:hypothetical protein [Arenibacter certesii]GGW26473.1 hypothetical protein GCM10007383_09480 [Arenibacter certesii]